MLMKTLSAWFIVVALLCYPMLGAAKGKNLDVERAAIIKADKDWLAVSKNAAAFIAATDPSFQFFPPNAPFMNDRKKIEEFWRGLLETPGLTVVWAPDGAVVAAGGDMGYSYGFYTLTTGAGGSNPVTVKGKYLTVMRKQPNGRWAPVADIFNANQ